MRLLHILRRAGALAALGLAPLIPGEELRAPVPPVTVPVILAGSAAPACSTGRCVSPLPKGSRMTLSPAARSAQLVAAAMGQSKAALARATFALG